MAMTPQQVLAVVGEYSARGLPPKPEEFWQSMEDTPIDKLTPEHLEVIEQAGLIHLFSELLDKQRFRQNSKS
jgi:hypothetical protein